MAFVPVTFAIPLYLWRWGDHASQYWALGYYLLVLGIVATATSVLSSGYQIGAVVTLSYFTIFSVGLMAFGWLQRKNGVPPARTPTSEPLQPPTLAVPPWLGDRLTFVYLQAEGFRTTYIVSRTETGYRVQMRDERVLKENAEYVERRRKEREASPEDWDESDEESLRKFVKEWFEFDFADSTGEFMVDFEKLPKRQVGDLRWRELGRERLSAGGGRFTALGFHSESEATCSCVEMAQIVMFWVAPGRCWRCAGILSKLRRCKKCGGTGRCGKCLGDGIHHWQSDAWYEVHTGILLRGVETRNGRRMSEIELESLTPNVLAAHAV